MERVEFCTPECLGTLLFDSLSVLVVEFCDFMRQNISGFLSLHRRHNELRSESDRKVASLEARLEATIRKYEAQLHILQTENERLKSDVTSAEHGANGKGTLLSSLLFVVSCALLFLFPNIN